MIWSANQPYDIGKPYPVWCGDIWWLVPSHVLHVAQWKVEFFDFSKKMRMAPFCSFSKKENVFCDAPPLQFGFWWLFHQCIATSGFLALTGLLCTQSRTSKFAVQSAIWPCLYACEPFPAQLTSFHNDIIFHSCKWLTNHCWWIRVCVNTRRWAVCMVRMMTPCARYESASWKQDFRM